MSETTEGTSLRELTEHLVNMEQLFYQRPSRGINLLEYNRIWWDEYQKRYPKLDAEVLADRLEEAENFVYRLCAYRDRGILLLFIRVQSARSVRPEYRELCIGDQRWREYCLEACKADKAELKYRYVAAQNILGVTYPDWQARDGDYFEEHIWPAVKDEYAKLHQESIGAEQRNKSKKPIDIKRGKTVAPVQQKAQPLSVPTGSSTEEPSYAIIVEKLKEKGWLTSDGKVKRQCKDLLSCARYFIDLKWANNNLIPKTKLVKELSKDYGLPTENRLEEYLGKPNEWFVNAKEWLK